ncbi:MAG TPA: helix-turn-helix domain-containing protein [Vicinamibacteria bacterium]|nr:helix-turn-helix domain-containing protein [Vicinamibacteria bacterium]
MATRAERARLRAASFKRSECPLACALDVFGDKWSLLIVRDLLLGRSRYSEFLRAGEGIPTNILAQRLTRLAEAGLVERRSSRDSRRRFEYRLTETGRKLGPIVGALVDWGRAQIRGTRVRAPHGTPPPRR